MSKSFANSRFRAGLLGLVAVFSLLAITLEAEAVRKNGVPVRAARALKKPPRIKPTSNPMYPNLTAIGITGQDAPAGGGCYIRGIVNGSPAQQAGLEAGDVIVQVENQSVATSADADNLVGQDILNNAPDVVMFVIDVNTGKTVGIVVPLSSQSPASPQFRKGKR